MEELIKEGARITGRLIELQQRLDEINGKLIKSAEFNGSKTGHLVGGGFTVKFVTRENTKWDHERLAEIQRNAAIFKNVIFTDVFKTETLLKPVSSKAVEIAMAKNEEFANAVEWARMVSQGKPTVTYSRIDDIPF